MNGRPPPRLLEQPVDQRGWRRRATAVGGDRDVHQVPDLVVARADQVAEQLVARPRREADARGLGELEHEHRQRPRRRERAPLDRDHRRQVAVGEPPDRRLAASATRLSGIVSLTPSLRVGGSQVDRGSSGSRRRRPPPPRERRRAARRRGGRGRHRPDLDAATRQAHHEIVPPPIRPPAAASGSSESRSASSSGVPRPAPRAARRRRRRARRRPRPGGHRAPPGGRRARRRPRRGPRAERIERADAGQRQAGAQRRAPRAVAMPTRRPVKEPGPIPTAIRSTASQPPAAAAARSTSASSAVVCRGPAVGREAEQRLVQHLAVAQRADGGVGGRGVEADVSAPGSARDREDEGADLLALDEPAHPVLAGDVRGDLVDVERPLDRLLAWERRGFSWSGT